MLDVHPPHQAAHGWRDFFIHIATIVVGLLIAVGLEQTVEAIHRHHERVELEELLRGEAERNSEALDLSRKQWATQAAWYTTAMDLVQKTPPAGGFVTVTLPTVKSYSSQPSQRSAWTLAKASGAFSLLPAAEQGIFERVDWIAEQEELSYQRYLQVGQQEQVAEKEAGVRLEPGATIRFPAERRDSLAHALANVQVAIADEADVLTYSEAYDMAIGSDPRSVEELRTRAYRNVDGLKAHP